MRNPVRSIRKEQSLGDTAVDGLLAGMGAGLGMLIYLVAVGLLSGRAITDILALFDPTPAGNSLSGILVHVALASIYGVIFAMLLRLLRRLWPAAGQEIWLTALIYSLLLFGLARGVLHTTVESPLSQVPLPHFAVAHLIYGLLLSYWLRKHSSTLQEKR